MAHLFPRVLWAAVVCIAASLLSGCLTRRQSDELGYGFTHALFFGMMDVPFWVDAFRRDKRRLPYDYAELSQYASRRTQSRVQLKPYARVDFALLPAGQRQAEFYSVVDGMTNKTSIVTWGNVPSGQRQAEFYSVVDGVTNKTSQHTWGKPENIR